MVAVTDDVSARDVVSLLSDVTGQTFVYGFANFVDEATAALDAAKLDPDDAKVESFGPAPEE